MESIPERRPEERPVIEEKSAEGRSAAGDVRVWRCKVCGYLCARVSPPEVCPICKVGRDRFEPFRFP